MQSEQHRFSLEHRLTKIETQTGQLVLDHAGLKNTIAELRKIVSILENFKLKSELRAQDAEDANTKHSKRVMWVIGITIAIVNALVAVVSAVWHHS